jgi:hypothetical protein
LGKDARFYPLSFANIIYDSHYYDNFASSDNGTTPYTGTLVSFKNNLKNDFLSFYDNSTGKFTVPLNVGEYGVVHGKFDKNLGAQQWLRNITDAMDYYGINRQLFNYHESRFGIYSGWNTYPGESTTTNTLLKTTIRELHGKPLPLRSDTLPDVFSFAAKTAMTPATAVESAAVTITGIDAPVPINIFNGQYRINNGIYTSVAKKVKNGDSVQLSHTSSSKALTTVTSTLIIGGKTASFSSTTH